MAAADSIVPSRGKALVMTDLAIEIPPNTYARIAPRSGLAWKHSLDTGAGVIDYDYRGNVGVILFNHGPNDFEVKRGDRIAQLILERISMAHCEEVQELGGTQRGEGGFGSTGVDGGSLKKPKTTDTAGACAVPHETRTHAQPCIARSLLCNHGRALAVRAGGSERFGEHIHGQTQGDHLLLRAGGCGHARSMYCTSHSC